jgi:lipoprotein-releasing system ATP-binding protein
MSRCWGPQRNKHILEWLWRDICSYQGERQVGKTGANPSTLGGSGNPPQVVENRKITNVSNWRKNALFLAGNRLAKKGNTLGHLGDESEKDQTARGLHLKHLSRQGPEHTRSERPSGRMMQQTQFASGKPADELSNAAVVLESRGLKKTYGTDEKSLHILVDANLSLRQGEMVAIVAPSGAGKSTLLHLLAALDTPTSGTVYFATKAIESINDEALAEFRNRAIGFLWQRHQLLPDFTAAENVAMPLLVRGEDFTSALGMARKWIAEVGLENRADHRAGELSGGEQQRIAIARALVAGPSVLLADEPTGDLDEKNAWAVFELLERLHRTHKLTSLIATHNLSLAARCDRVLVLEHGVLRTREATAPAGGVPGGEAS